MHFKSPVEFNNKLSFIFHAQLALPLAAFVYLFLEIKHRNLQPAIDAGENMPLIIGIMLAAGLSVAGTGYFLFRKQLKDLSELGPFQERLSAYFKAVLILYSLVEAGSIIMIAGLYLTTSTFFIVGYMFLLLILSLNRPTPQKYVGDVRMSDEERDIILHKRPFKTEE